MKSPAVIFFLVIVSFASSLNFIAVQRYEAITKGQEAIISKADKTVASREQLLDLALIGDHDRFALVWPPRIEHAEEKGYGWDLKKSLIIESIVSVHPAEFPYLYSYLDQYVNEAGFTQGFVNAWNQCSASIAPPTDLLDSLELMYRSAFDFHQCPKVLDKALYRRSAFSGN